MANSTDRSKRPRPIKALDWNGRMRQQAVELQRLWVWYVLTIYALAVVATFTVIFLNGFHVRGFNLDLGILRSLGVATVGEVGGLVYVVAKLTCRASL